MMTKEELESICHNKIELTSFQTTEENGFTVYFKTKEKQRNFVIEIWRSGDIFYCHYALMAMLGYEEDYEKTENIVNESINQLQMIIESKEENRLPFLLGTYVWQEGHYEEI